MRTQALIDRLVFLICRHLEHRVQLVLRAQSITTFTQLSLDLMLYTLNQLSWLHDCLAIIISYFAAFTLLVDRSGHLLAKSIEVASDHAFHGIFSLDVTAVSAFTTLDLITTHLRRIASIRLFLCHDITLI